MFDIGFWELALIAVIGLIVLGPERLPTVARSLGLWVGRARGYMRSLTSELEREVNTAELRRDLEGARDEFEAGGRDVEAGGRQFDAEVRGYDKRQKGAAGKKKPPSMQGKNRSDSDDSSGDSGDERKA